jgi:hypothetical protein
MTEKSELPFSIHPNIDTRNVKNTFNSRGDKVIAFLRYGDERMYTEVKENMLS